MKSGFGDRSVPLERLPVVNVRGQAVLTAGQ